MKKNIITIGRQLGSGGRTVGKKLADALGIAYYDRELIDEVAKQSGFSAAFIEKTEEKANNNFLYNLGMSTGGYFDVISMTGDTAPLSTQVFLAQQKVILSYAQKPCVIVGRCADYFLRDRDDVLSVFLYADHEKRVERAVKHYGCDRKKALDLIAKSDKASPAITSPICNPETDDFGTFSVIFWSAFSRRTRRNAHHSPTIGTIAVRMRKMGLTNLISDRAFLPHATG